MLIPIPAINLFIFLKKSYSTVSAPFSIATKNEAQDECLQMGWGYADFVFLSFPLTNPFHIRGSGSVFTGRLSSRYAFMP